MSSGAFATKFNPTKWYRAGLKFACPLSNHQREMSTCAEFFSLSPEIDGIKWRREGFATHV